MSSVFQGTRLTIGFWPGTLSPPLLRHPSTKPSIADPGDSSTLNGSGPILPPPVFVMAHWAQLRLAALLRRPSGSTRPSRIYPTHMRRWPRSPAACVPRPTGGMTLSAVPRNVMLDGSSAATKRHFRERLVSTGWRRWDRCIDSFDPKGNATGGPKLTLDVIRRLFGGRLMRDWAEEEMAPRIRPLVSQLRLSPTSSTRRSPTSGRPPTVRLHRRCVTSLRLTVSSPSHPLQLTLCAGWSMKPLTNSP